MGRMAALLLPLCVAISTVFAADPPAAISVDDTSPLLTYDNINHWTTHVNTPARFNLYSNSDTFSDVRGAWVSFTFNGTSIEYWGNQGPYHGPCLVRLEDGSSQTVNSHYTVDADPILLFSKYDLSSTQQHTINVTVVDPSFPNVCEIDRFVYTPIATSTPTPVKAKSSSVKYIAIGAGVGGALVLAVLIAFILFQKRRTRRRKHSAGPGVLEDSLFTTAYDPAPVSSSTSPLTSTFAHTPSIMSNAKSAEAVTPSGLFPTPFPYRPPGHNPANLHKSTSTSTSIPSGSYYQPSVASDEKSFGGRSSPVDSSAFSVTSGEGSSAMYHPLVVPGTLSPLPPGAAAAAASSSSSSSAPFYPAPAMPPIPAVVQPFQHEDAGRVPEEVPPAYKDSWNPQPAA